MKKIIIIAGDPNSINSEIIFKVWKKLSKSTKKRIFLIANHNLIKAQAKRLKVKINLKKIDSIDCSVISNYLKILDVPLRFKKPFRVQKKDSEKYVIKSLNLGHKLAQNNEVKGLINCAIDKSLLKLTKRVGVTEFFAKKCKVYDNSEVMLIYNKKLSVVPLTTHIKLKKVSNTINKNLIVKKILSLDANYKKIFKFRPNIAVLGLNPHNDELKKNSEEKRIILPSIKKLKNRGLKITGPLVADTVFVNDYKNYDTIVGMYHDQVLGPFKTIFKFDAMNITLGLNYVRVSPDHGTALNIVGKKKGNHLSLLNCVKFIDNLNK